MFKCKICDYTCHYNYSGTHLKKKHNITGKTYYDSFIKTKKEGFCKICNSKTSFFTIKEGYKDCCSLGCANKYKNILLKENFGVDNYFQLDSVKQKIREKRGWKEKKFKIKKPKRKLRNKEKNILNDINVEATKIEKEIRKNIQILNEIKKDSNILKNKITKYRKNSILSKDKENLLTKYNVKSVFQIPSVKEKTKQTLREKYGVENISQLESVKEKKKRTLLKNYGVEFGLQHPEIKKKQERTMLKKYGKKQAMHVPELKRKAVLNGGGRCSARFYTTKFGDKITIQGSYEEKFVKLCEDNNIRIVNGPCIDYLINGEQHKYFVDFIIYQNNKPRLVEIKSSYYFEEYKEQCLAKAEAAIKWSQKYQYLDYALLIDKIEIPLD